MCHEMQPLYFFSLNRSHAMNLLPSLLALAAASAAASALAQAPNQQNENAANAKCGALKNAPH